jgi:hypothetical protein
MSCDKSDTYLTPRLLVLDDCDLVHANDSEGLAQLLGDGVLQAPQNRHFL